MYSPIAPIINNFFIQYPEVKLDLRLSDGLSNLVEEDLDVVIRIGNLDRSGANLILHKIGSYTRLVCGSSTYFAKHGKPQHPDDLANHNCLLFTYFVGYDVWRFKRDTEVCEIKVSGYLISGNSEVLRQVCLDGASLILMPT
ncbi:MAG: substrate binding domain-containing protein [Chroococcus sp. CMT-3BRIN-NPC107]|nr:substrate binding domain-containing protein [Chroococcus sp. CMT-3BRIN-NPC107]